MVIAHNLMANFTERQLNINTKSKSKSAERLGSGYRINRAADDAASLAISEKMRGQIRGLEKAADNILDGSNMIATAEGAITEQIEILQRIRELTVQSYNDTNTQEDRFAIQEEVDELLVELNRVSRDTEFNTIKVLQGPKVTQTVEIIPPDTEYSDCTFLVSSKKKFPSWATYDSELILNNSNIGTGNVQDTSQYVNFNEDQLSDANLPETAYGPQPSADKITEDNWQREWTTTMADNYSARVDFSAIASLTSKDDLYTYLGDLVGTGIGYECYTCERVQGVCFSAEDVKIRKIMNDERASKDFGDVTLQPYIEWVDGLIDETEFNALTPTEQVDKGGSYANYVNKMAKSIAENIVNDIITKTDTEDHFVRTLKDVSNPYQVVFYDFRDDGVTKADALAGDVLDEVLMDIEATVTVKNQPVELTKIERDGYHIQAGANTEQDIVINFPDTSLEAIDMVGYNVFPDGYCSITDDKKYDPELLKGATQIGENLYQNQVGGVVQTQTTTVTGTKEIHDYDIIITPGYNDANGEWVKPVPTLQITGTRQEPYSYTYTTTTVVGGTLKQFYAYKPDNLMRVDRAIQSLSDSRSYLGAMTNRLEHAYLNDTNTAENLQAAESRIRDADMADEMVQYSKSNILEQAANAMLAQANQSTQGILQLLQ